MLLEAFTHRCGIHCGRCDSRCAVGVHFGYVAGDYDQEIVME